MYNLLSKFTYHYAVLTSSLPPCPSSPSPSFSQFQQSGSGGALSVSELPQRGPTAPAANALDTLGLVANTRLFVWTNDNYILLPVSESVLCTVYLTIMAFCSSSANLCWLYYRQQGSQHGVKFELSECRRAVGTGPANPAAAGPIIWQARIFMFTTSHYINFRERELILVEFMPSDVRF